MNGTFKDLPATYWETLDMLIKNGWRPCINQLNYGEETWHVSLSHVTAPIPTVYFNPVKGIFAADEHRYRIHGHGRSLSLAFDDAFTQVNNLLEPKEPQQTP